MNEIRVQYHVSFHWFFIKHVNEQKKSFRPFTHIQGLHWLLSGRKLCKRRFKHRFRKQTLENFNATLQEQSATVFPDNTTPIQNGFIQFLNASLSTAAVSVIIWETFVNFKNWRNCDSNLFLFCGSCSRPFSFNAIFSSHVHYQRQIGIYWNAFRCHYRKCFV